MVQFRNEEQLKEWLESQEREVAVAIAARVALRALPSIQNHVSWNLEAEVSATVLLVFRAIAPPWLARTWPSQGGAAAAYAADATTTAYAANIAIWSEVEFDVDQIESGITHLGLMRNPLWSENAPDLFH